MKKELNSVIVTIRGMKILAHIAGIKHIPIVDIFSGIFQKYFFLWLTIVDNIRKLVSEVLAYGFQQWQENLIIYRGCQRIRTECNIWSGFLYVKSLNKMI